MTGLLVSALLVGVTLAGCPFGFGRNGKIGKLHEERDLKPVRDARASPEYIKAAMSLDWDAVVTDIKKMFVTDQPHIYPIDRMLDGTSTYAPFFVRQAWHCSGSYRVTDGLGGCSGGRQRFNPELSWPDNTNLDKAKRLMWGIKEKHGLGLSWGDLMILAGKVAIEEMNGPWIPFCAGRPDDEDGYKSELLGPTLLQQEVLPCYIQGECDYPFGTTNIGLIYVNPGGHMGNWLDLKGSVRDINVTFAHMSMDAEETVGLIGGGHSFGKTHGACPLNASNPSVWPDPQQDPMNPWPINACPNGTFTTGFEGFWTSKPNQWTNEYFIRISQHQNVPVVASGGNWQYQQMGKTYLPNETLMLLPTDVSLMHDPMYAEYARKFAANFSYLTKVFQGAWYKLTTRDAGPITRCLNVSIGGRYSLTEADFYHTLPPAPATQPSWDAVKNAFRSLMFGAAAPAGYTPDQVRGQNYWGAAFQHVAFQCAQTVRVTDHLGGCNGARIRFSPQSNWPENNGNAAVYALIAQVQQSFPTLTYADAIVLAGSVALEEATGHEVRFCPGRADATHGYPEGYLIRGFDVTSMKRPFVWTAKYLGLQTHEWVALQARPRSANQMARAGHLNGTWSTPNGLANVSNVYFQVLLNNRWTALDSDGKQYKSANGDFVMAAYDLQLTFNPELKAIAQTYAEDNEKFVREYVKAWVKLMNMDRFDGPVNNVCDRH